MKILYITLPAPDHITDQIYTGLCNILGAENVVDFPYKAAYHDPGMKVWFLPQVESRCYTSEEILALLERHEFSMVCIAARRVAFERLACLWGKAKFPPMVIIDGEEDTRIRHELWAKYPFSVYFKRDYVWGMRGRALDFLEVARSFKGDLSLFRRTYPLPLSVALESIPDTEALEKDIDVSYIGRASHRSRVNAVKLLKHQDVVYFDGGLYQDPGDKMYKLKGNWVERMKDKCFPRMASRPSFVCARLRPETDGSGYSPYFDHIHRSKVAISLRGGGLTPPIRYYEIVACRTLLLSDPPASIIPNNFEHGRHAVFFRKDMSDLVKLAHYYVQHDGEREAIIKEGYTHLLKYHTCERRAEYFLDICRRVI